MPGNGPWPARDGELRELHGKGYQWQRIADEMHLAMNTVKSHGQRLGLCEKRSCPWPERDAELKALHAEGMTWPQIARKMGLSPLAVKSHGCRMLGLNNARFSCAPPRPEQSPPHRSRMSIPPGTSTLPPFSSTIAAVGT